MAAFRAPVCFISSGLIFYRQCNCTLQYYSLLTPPLLPPPQRPLPGPLYPNSTQQWEPNPSPASRPLLQQEVMGHGRPELAPGRHRHTADPPSPPRLLRGSQLTTIQPTKRQPATTGEVDLGGRVTMISQTMTRAAPGCSPLAHIRMLAMH